MKRIQALGAILFAVILLLLSVSTVNADTGPHPTMEFQLVWQIPRVSVVDASLFFCRDAACENPEKVGGPFSCSAESCWYNYGSEGSYKLVIEFNDKTRESNIFEKRGFEAVYVAQVYDDDLVVEQTNLPLPYAVPTQVLGFFASLLLTWAIEIPIGIFLLKRWRLPRRRILLLVANLITLPIVWFLFPLISDEILYVILLGELFAWIFEAIFYYLIMRGSGLSAYQALILSLIANLASLFLPASCIWIFLSVIY